MPMAGKKIENKAVGMSRGGRNTKIHTLVDGLGNPLAFMLSSGNDHDSVHAVSLLSQVNIERSNILGDKAYGANLKGIFFLTQAIANHSLIKKRGTIVNISSQHGIVGNDSRAHYCASKAGIIGLTKALASEWAKYKVRVNCVSPTFIITEKNSSYLNSPYSRQVNLNKIPLGEYALPEDVSNGIIFLISSNARMITGHNLVIDGGYTII